MIVIGVGNEYRRDDGAGPVVIERLRSRRLPDVELADSDGEPSQLLELWDGVDLAIVVDSVRAPGAPGRIRRVGTLRGTASQRIAASSHGMSLGTTVDLARVLDRMPRRLLFYGITVADVEQGIGLTAAVRSAAVRVADEICDLAVRRHRVARLDARHAGHGR